MKVNTLKIHGYTISFTNLFEFLTLYKDTFLLKEYHFTTLSKKPYILDCGSHIGDTILYFKRLYPHADIVGFEPTEETFQLLKKNVEQNKLTSVRLIKAAVYSKNGHVQFYTQKDPQGFSYGNSIVNDKLITGKHVRKRVDSVRLSSFIDRPVDLIKLDIEGAELAVLTEIKNKLHLVKNIILELHTKGHDKRKLYEEVASLLKNHSFGHTVREIGLLKSKAIKPNQVKTSKSELFLIKAER